MTNNIYNEKFPSSLLIAWRSDDGIRYVPKQVTDCMK